MGVRMRKSWRSSAEPWFQRSKTAAELKTTEAAASTSRSISSTLARRSGRATGGGARAARGAPGTRGGGGPRPHDARRAHGVGEAREIDHLHHLLEARVHLSHHVGHGALVGHLARGHGARAELVLEAVDDPAVL